MSGRPHSAAIHRVIPVKAAAVTLADKVAPQQPDRCYFPRPDADAVKRNARARAHIAHEGIRFYSMKQTGTPRTRRCLSPRVQRVLFQREFPLSVFPPCRSYARAVLHFNGTRAMLRNFSGKTVIEKYRCECDRVWIILSRWQESQVYRFDVVIRHFARSATSTSIFNIVFTDC